MEDFIGKWFASLVLSQSLLLNNFTPRPLVAVSLYTDYIIEREINILTTAFTNKIPRFSLGEKLSLFYVLQESELTPTDCPSRESALSERLGI